MNKFFLPLLLPLLSAMSAHAQLAELRGFVYDSETGEPLMFANVYFKGTTTGVNSDMDGFYSLSRVKPGRYTLQVTTIGYDTFSQEIVLMEGEIKTRNIYLQSSNYQLREVEISGKRTELENESRVSVVKVTPLKIKKLPSVGGVPDFAQYIQIIPGVIFSGDQGGQLYVRGGSPIQNKVLLDGMSIYNPFHSIGLFSVFDTDIIRSVDVYTGGFPSKYGGRISAIMDIKTRDGNRKEFAGILRASPFAAKLLLEGPIKKFSEGKGSSSLLFSGRTSFLDKTGPIFYPYADDNKLPYSFLDFYTKYSAQSNKGSKFDFFGFSYNDAVNFPSSTSYNWNALGAGTHFLYLPEATSTVIEGNFAWSDYEMIQSEADASPRRSRISGFEGGMNFKYYMGASQLKYGARFIGFSTDFEFRNAANRTVSQTEFTTELAGYLHYKIKHKRLILEPGLRLHYFASLAELSPEPRLMGKYLISDHIRFKFSSGIYAQNLVSARSDRDVVNLFYGFLSGPDDLPNTFRGQDVNSRLQKARHLIAGFEFDIRNTSFFNIEGYYKNFNQLSNINRNKIFDDNQEYENKDVYLKSDYIIERGYAYGVDFNYEYEKDRAYAWVTYSLGLVKRQDELIEYYPHWDRRHNVNILLSYTAGEKRNYEFSARWNFGSGFPFTQTQGYYELLDFGSGANTDYRNNNGELGIIYADLNQGRLTAFHRLDLSGKWHKEFQNNSELEITLSVTNAYDRTNIFYFDRVSHERVNQLPILPSAGVTYSF